MIGIVAILRAAIDHEARLGEATDATGQELEPAVLDALDLAWSVVGEVTSDGIASEHAVEMRPHEFLKTLFGLRIRNEWLGREDGGWESDHIAGFVPHLGLLAHGGPLVGIVELAEIPEVLRPADEDLRPGVDLLAESFRCTVRILLQQMGKAGDG